MKNSWPAKIYSGNKMTDWSIKQNIFLLTCFLLLGSLAIGQDLGSSNKLFGGKKSGKTESKTAKKAPAVKGKRTSSRPGSSVSKTRSDPQKEASSKSVKIAPSKSSADTKTTVKKTPLVTASTARYEELIDDGNSARDNRNYAVAETAYKRAILVKPKDSRAVFGLGNLYSDQQRWEDAGDAYRKALQLEPANAVAHIALSYVLSQPISAPNLSERYEEAEVLARRAIELAGTNPLAFDQLGVSLELRGLIGEETEQAYRRAIVLDPAFALPYAHLGRLLRRRGLTQESAAAYKKAVELSRDAATMILVADVMQSEQRFAESEQLLQKALKSDPKNPAGLHLLGRALTAQEKYFDAERVLRTSLDSNPNGYVVNSLLASLYTRQNRFDLAENALLRALVTVSPFEKRSLAQQFEMLGDGYMKAGKDQNAERSYRQAIQLDPENASLSVKLTQAQRG